MEDLVQDRGRAACLRPARFCGLVLCEAFRAVDQMLHRFPQVLYMSMPLSPHQVVCAAANLLATQQLLNLVLLLVTRVSDRAEGGRSIFAGVEGLQAFHITVGLHLKRPGGVRVYIGVPAKALTRKGPSHHGRSFRISAASSSSLVRSSA